MTKNFKLFTEQDIIRTYKKYVQKSPEYYKKADIEYPKLSDEERRKLFNVDFPRVASLIDFKEWIIKYGLDKPESLLSTFKNDFELSYISCDNITYCPYTGGNNGDLHTLDLPKKDFQFIIFNQTLEHLYNPFICMQNLFNHLKPKGYLYTTVPTINIPHMVPFHFWGITPTGLCMLSKSVGFEICECGFWGNYEYLKYIFTKNEWPSNDAVFDLGGNIQNTEVCQAQTWVLVQKP